jgi:hypothetical protein
VLVAHSVPGKAKSADLCAAFIAGAPKGAVGAVFYGVVDANVDAWKKVLKSGEPYYWIDGSYFDCVRNVQYRITKNAIQVRGAGEQQSDGKRFAALDLTLKPRVTRQDGHTLLVEQSEAFMRLIAKDPGWLKRMSGRIGSDKVKVRPWDANKIKLQSTLIQDLQSARLLVAHTSAAAVTATVEGVPIAVSSHHALYDMPWFSRQHHLNVLADNQFSVDEMKDGSAYRWLNR